MSKQWRLAPVLAIFMTLMMFVISACGGGTSTGGTSTGGGNSGSTGSTPTTSSGGGSSSTAGTPGSYNCVQSNISISGSTALYPLVKAVSGKYSAKCSGASFTITPNGSGTGLSQVASGAVQIGMSDVFKKSVPEQQGLVDHQVAVVIFGLIMNSKITGVTNLTIAQLKDIYSGKTTSWSQVGGPNLKIVVVSRPANSGTRQTFQKFILGGNETVSGPSNLTTDSTGTVVKNVQQTDGAIGYVSLSAAKSSGLKIAQIDGSTPGTDVVKNNTYKFWNFEHMYTKGPASGLAQALIDYMASDDGKSEAATLSFVPISDMSSDAVSSHTPSS